MPRKPFIKAPQQPAINPRCIDVTSEYGIFKRMPGNRSVSETHVVKLMDAMREHDLFVPILVNHEFEVIDGQHRLEARKRLGLPVPYYWEENLSLRDVQGLNSTQKGWRNEDFTAAYIELGNENYKIYKWFRQQYGIPHGGACLLLTGQDTHSLREEFQSGRLRVTDLEGGKKKVAMLREIAPLFTHWKDLQFIRAFLIVLNRDGFDFKTFVHRLKQNPTMVYPSTTIDGYLRMIEEIYNYRSPKKIPLRYGKDKAEQNGNDPETS